MSRTRAPARPARLRWRVLSWLFTGAVLSCIGLAAGTGVASAHAVLMSTSPAPDAVLPDRPAQVSLTFGESVQLPPSAIRVLDPDGHEVDDGHPRHPGPDAAVVAVGLRPGAAQGSYTVAWRVVSADTHPVTGAFVFSVGHPSATSAAPAAPPGGSRLVGLLYGIVRAVAFGSFAALVGAGALVLCCWPAGPAPAAARMTMVGGWGLLLLSSVGTLLLQGPYGDGTGLASVFTPGTVAATLQLPLGGALVARLLLLTASAVYLGQLAAGRRGHLLTGLGAVLAAALAATWSVSGHAAVGPQPWLALPADIAHLMAMAVWVGGLFALTLATWHRSPDPNHQRRLVASAARFSPIAFGCVTVLVITGGYQAVRQLGSVAALLDTEYGHLLALKLLGVAAMLAAAGYSRRAVAHTGRAASLGPAVGHDPVASLGPAVGHGPAAVGQPRPGGSPDVDALSGATGSSGIAAPDRTAGATVGPGLRRGLAMEAFLAVLVLAITAMLTNAEPGRSAEPASAAAAPSAASSAGPTRASLAFNTGGAGGTGTLDVTLNPGRTGPNILDVTVRAPGGRPEDVPELRATLALPARHLGPLDLPLTRRNLGSYAAHQQVSLPGRWTLSITVRTSDFDETTVTLPVTID